MGELHEVAAGSHASVLWNIRDYVGVDHPDKQFHQVRMDSRPGLEEGPQPRNHRGLYIYVFKRFSRSGGMAPDYVVLQVGEILVIYPPLSHRAETRIDAVDYLFRLKFLEKLIALPDFLHRKPRDINLFPPLEQLFHSLKAEFKTPFHPKNPL